MSRPRYGSDVMVDAIKACGFPYVALNPGSSYRGLHDSLVNYGGNDPQIITCNHEKIAVGIAHGYAKATDRPMAVILHDLVGLLHGAMGIYYAYIDRVPMVVFGGAGPMAYDRRRPNIDWIHSANVQGNAVRDYTKWDDQPFSIASVSESITRGYRVATAAPQGPVYIALDAGLQEQQVDGDLPTPNFDRLKTPAPIGPDPVALRRLAETFVAAEHRDSGRLVVDLQPDGDLMYDLGALWIAAYHRIPLLVVMFNNRAYYNDWEHQERIARHRGTDVSRAYIGMEIDKPAPDFAAIARALGWPGEGASDPPPGG